LHMEETTATRYVNSAIWIEPEIHVSRQTQQPSGGSLPGDAAMLIFQAASPGSPCPFLRSLRSRGPGDMRSCCRACAGDNTATAPSEGSSSLRPPQCAALPGIPGHGHGSTWAMTGTTIDHGRTGLPSEPSCWAKSEPMSRTLYAVARSGEARGGVDLADADIGCPLTATGDADRVLCPL
jgi:hypothetical protein